MISRLDYGTSAAYLAARLKRDAPEILAAANKIEAARRKTGKTWHQLLGIEPQ